MERLCLCCNSIFIENLRLCKDCQIQFKKSALHTAQSGIHVLYAYSSEIRHLVHLAKIENRFAALDAIAELCFQHPLFHKALDSSKACIAAPSSLWGRLHGRHDIPGFLAVKMADHSKSVPEILRAPWLNYMNWKKRSLEHERSSHLTQLQHLIYRHNSDNKNPSCLVVDDILTTGATLLRLLKTPILKKYRWNVFIFASNRTL